MSIGPDFVAVAPLGSTHTSRTANTGRLIPRGWSPIADAQIGAYFGMLLQHDGTYRFALLTCAGGNGADKIHTVDARRVRQELAAIGIFPSSPPPSTPRR